MARAKEAGRPLWSSFHKFQRDERRQFEARERTLAGKVSNAIAAAKVQQRRGTEGNPQGFLSMAFAYVGSRDARAQAFAAEQARMRQGFAAEQKAKADSRLEAIKQVRAETLAKSRTVMLAERGALIERHRDERAKVREAWRQLNLQRGRTPTRLRQENPTMPSMDEFRRVAQIPDPNQPKMQPTTPRAVAEPAPAPSPAGVPPLPARSVQDVPRVDRAAEWAKTDQGRADMARHQPTPPARAQFERSAFQDGTVKFGGQDIPLKGNPEIAKALDAVMRSLGRTVPDQTEKPAPQPVASQQSRAAYWNERAQSKAGEMSRDQPRDKSQNRNQDQDQEPNM